MYMMFCKHLQATVRLVQQRFMSLILPCCLPG